MNNPWKELSGEIQEEYVLKSDKSNIDEYNEKHGGNETEIKLDLPPSPIVGNFDNAEYVIVMLNTGYPRTDEDLQTEKDEFKNDVYRKLVYDCIHRKKETAYNFAIDWTFGKAFGLDFESTGGYRYWRDRLLKYIFIGLRDEQLKGLLEYYPISKDESGFFEKILKEKGNAYDKATPIEKDAAKELAQKILTAVCVVEFPYRSRKFGGFKGLEGTEAYKYFIELLIDSLNSKKTIILVRQVKNTLETVSGLKDYKSLYKVNNPQSVFLKNLFNIYQSKDVEISNFWNGRF